MPLTFISVHKGAYYKKVQSILEVIDMLTKGAIGNLINRYKAVLKKCHLLNTFGSLAAASMLIMGGAGVSMGQDYTLTSDSNQPITVNMGENSIIDLNGFSLNSATVPTVQVYGSATIDSSQDNGSILSNDMAVQMSPAGMFGTANLTVNGGIIKAENSDPYVAATGIGMFPGMGKTNLTVNGGTISGSAYGIVGNGANNDNTTVTINDGYIESTAGTAIYQPQKGTMTIHGGRIVGAGTGIEVRSGDVNITNGYIAGMNDILDTRDYNNGPTVYGAAIAVSQHTTQHDININISGGTFDGIYAIYEADHTDGKLNSNDGYKDNVNISITDGTFNGSIYSQHCDDFITGGTFSHPTALDYLGKNANVAINLTEDYDRKNDINQSGFTIGATQNVTMDLGEYRFSAPSLAVDKGGALLVNLPDGGGVAPESDKAFLALGRSLDLNDIGKLRVGTVSSSSAAAAFGADSTLVVDGKAASDQAMITGSGELSVADGAQLYIANAEANTDYIITEGLTSGEGEYWTEANLLANRLIKATISRDGDAVVVETEVKDVASALPGVIPVSGLTGMLAQNLNNTDSSSMGIRFLSRAVEPLYMGDDAKAVATINEVSRAAVTAGVQNTALRLADAGVDQLIHHLSLSFFGKENNIHKDGVDIWATPMYGNTYTHGMVASGAAVRGNYGGVTLGADAKVGEILGGKVRVGAAVNGGGGKSETRGTATSTDNEYNFGGVNLYAGWNLDSLNVMASVGYAMANHDVKMNLPASMGMGQAKADVDTNAFIADLRAEYQINTSVADILPHAGVRYTALNTESHDLKVNGSTLNSVASDTQHIVQFPIGVTVSKDIDVSGWNVKPLADVSVIPAAGEKKNTTKVSYAGIGALDSVNTRIMDSTSWAGTVGVQAEKGNFALGLNYGVQASTHETDQSVSVGISWKF